MNIFSVHNPNFHATVDYLVTLTVDSLAGKLIAAIGYPSPPPAEGAQPDPSLAASTRVVNGASYVMTDPATLDMAALHTLHTWCDHQVYILCTQPGNAAPLMAPTSLYANTLNERLAPQDFAARGQFNIAAALAVPFKNSTFDDCTLLVNLPGDRGGLVIDAGATVVDKGRGRLIDLWQGLLPSITLAGPGTVAAGQSASMSAQLVDAAGSPIRRSGVEIYFDAVIGTPNKSRAVTDANGACSLVCTAADLVAGDVMRVKAGFKFFAGAADISVAVQ